MTTYRYPTVSVGQKLTATLLDGFVPTVYKKAGSDTRTSTAAVTDDPELTGIALEIGSYDLSAVIYFTGTTGDIQMRFGFTGTYGGLVGWTGPSPGTELLDHTAATMRNNAAPPGNAQTFGHNSASVYAVVRVDGIVDVSVAGNLSLQWGQQTSDVTATGVMGESFIRVNRIA